MLSTRSPIGAMIEITIASSSRWPLDVQVSLHSPMPTTTRATIVSNDPPMNPSTVLWGLIHARSGVRPAAEPTNIAPMSLATTPRASRKSVSVPHVGDPGIVEKRRINTANEPSNPIQIDAERRDRRIRHRARPRRCDRR